MKRILGTAALVVALAGCHATGQKITRLDPGSSRDTVLATLGRPDAVRTFGDFEVYTYLARHRKRTSLSHTDYTVVLKEGQVVQFGPGLAQREGLHGVTIVPPQG
ncbi:outer membrane protein assembly factor BamE domain-containing protein [Dyella telluris]|jgi:outer membrane protein assembly factor BamE (lipoprotein component of BamABCDE complex)|uniref:Outer membrane protein assembly factor BamE n=1 Tax=Dyella telluris TaxID=2763498 RepID=A0A7G8Q3E9_9GAMM|nr:outer membrane protein assembly factor BamE [Dyella telluris]QNK01307.1 outer membrane protein assembly factor BamE [Dyella telluris]